MSSSADEDCDGRVSGLYVLKRRRPGTDVEAFPITKLLDSGQGTMDGADEAIEKGAMVTWKAPEKEPFVGEVTDRAGTPESLQGGNDGGIQMTATRLLPVVTLKRVQEEDHDEDSPLSLNEDFEKGKAVDDDSTSRGSSSDVESAPSYHHQDTNDQPVCRVCRDSTGTVVDDVISLGCACLLDWGRMHKRCAETWFQAKGNRECELCGELARNVQLPQFMYDDRWAFTNERIVIIEIGRGQFSELMEEILDYFSSKAVWSRIKLIWCYTAMYVLGTSLLGVFLCLTASLFFRVIWK